MQKEGIKVLAQNKKAWHDFFIEDVYEVGIVLTGTEIKSLRTGRANLKDGYARIINGEIWMMNVHISEYEQGNRYNHDPLRVRKLLMHRREIHKLIGQTKVDGYSLVPLRMYLKGGFCKVEIGVAKGKKNYDKRETIKNRDAQREIHRALRERNK